MARALAHADALRQSELAVYLDAAGADALNAHDGAEHLHRVLWDLDVPHDYRLRSDADHIGPDILERLRAAFSWLGTRLSSPVLPPLSATELAWRKWLDGELTTEPPAPLPPTSRLFPRVLRAQLEPLRSQAALRDPSLARRCGLLPPVAGTNERKA